MAEPGDRRRATTARLREFHIAAARDRRRSRSREWLQVGTEAAPNAGYIEPAERAKERSVLLPAPVAGVRVARLAALMALADCAVSESLETQRHPVVGPSRELLLCPHHRTTDLATEMQEAALIDTDGYVGTP